MSWVIVQRLPQENNRIVGVFVAKEDALESSYPAKRRNALEGFAVSIARSNGFQRPCIGSYTGIPDTAEDCHITVYDEVPATDIHCYDFVLHKSSIDLTKEYMEKFERPMLEDEP